MAGPPSPKRQRTGDKEATTAAPEIEPEKLQKVLEDVGAIEEQVEAEDEKMAAEVLVVESKCNAAKRPIYEKRAKLLRDIPGFWKKAISSHPFIAGTIGEVEEKALDALVDVDVTFIDEAGGFKIEFSFAENPFFGETKLWKQITYKEDEEIEVTASEIPWKPTDEGNDLKGQAPSFFEWLAATDGEEEDIAEYIKDDIWKNPVIFYSREAAEDDDSEDEEGDDEEEDEEEEDNEGEE